MFTLQFETSGISLISRILRKMISICTGFDIKSPSLSPNLQAAQTNRQMSSWQEWWHWRQRKDRTMARGFRTAFATKISLTDWTSKMVARVQQPGESIMQYAMAKEKLLAMAPVALTDQQKVQALTEGLRPWQHQAAVMSTNPANVAAFYTACNNLPTSLAAPAAEKPTKSADPVDPSAALEAVANRMKESVDMAPEPGRQAGLAEVRQLGEDGEVEERQQHRACDLFRFEAGTDEVLTTRTTLEKISSKSVRFGEVRVTVFDRRKAAVDSKCVFIVIVLLCFFVSVHYHPSSLKKKQCFDVHVWPIESGKAECYGTVVPALLCTVCT
ncbi:hypothetical protein GHT06_007140 [Daphnia sinensis]|uniref:Retrotransposon gag domain-containing protein n=1 Tax=Daphnia sinensis TaxID=1820382 RepID=A0AAD5KFQ9_9CRUS|nr:hypothetical protein GHT06_007140 [Daphnia sinensis]